MGLVWTLMIQRNLMIPKYSMIPAIWWSPAIRWSEAIQWYPAIRWSIASMDFDNLKVYGDTIISDGLVVSSVMGRFVNIGMMLKYYTRWNQAANRQGRNWKCRKITRCVLSGEKSVSKNKTFPNCANRACIPAVEERYFQICVLLNICFPLNTFFSCCKQKTFSNSANRACIPDCGSSRAHCRTPGLLGPAPDLHF